MEQKSQTFETFRKYKKEFLLTFRELFIVQDVEDKNKASQTQNNENH